MEGESRAYPQQEAEANAESIHVDVEKLESDIDEYRELFKHIIPLIEEDYLREKTEVVGQYEGTEYKARLPHLRRGKHGAVVIIEIIKPSGEKFSCVAKHNLYDANTYYEDVKRSPVIAGYIPKYYGAVENWIVMERLEGLELEELIEKIKSDRTFLLKYATETVNLIERATSEGLRLCDIQFHQGHNCMIDSETARIRLIELQTLRHQSDWKSNELMADQILGELYSLGGRNEVHHHQIAFLFQVLRLLRERMDLNNLFMRPIHVRPTDPRYRNAYYIQNWEALSDEQYEGILANPNLRENLTVDNSCLGYTKGLHPEIIKSVMDDNFEDFSQLLMDRKVQIDITDESDPRSKPIISETPA